MDYINQLTPTYIYKRCSISNKTNKKNASIILILSFIFNLPKILYRIQANTMKTDKSE